MFESLPEGLVCFGVFLLGVAFVAAGLYFGRKDQL